MAKWAEYAATPDYATKDDATKEALRVNWFADNVAKDLLMEGADEGTIQKYRDAFDADTAPGLITKVLNKVPGLPQAVKDGISFDTRTQFTGPNEPSREVKGKIHEAGTPGEWQTIVPQPKRLGAGGTAALLAQQVKEGITTHFPAALSAVREGGTPDFSNQEIAESERVAKRGASRLDARTPTVIPFVSKEDLRLGPSLGFSGAAMTAGIPVGMAASALTTPIGGVVAGGAASGAASYRAAQNQFARQIIAAAQDEHKAILGREMTQGEIDLKLAAFEKEIQEYGLWEAIPEAASNMLGFGILKAPIGGAIGRVFGKNVAERFAKKSVALGASEVLPEGVTQQGQHNVQAAVDAEERKKNPTKPRSWTSPSDLADSVGEVAAQTILQTGVMAGATKAGMGAWNLAEKGVSAARGEIPELKDRVPDPNIGAPAGRETPATAPAGAPGGPPPGPPPAPQPELDPEKAPPKPADAVAGPTVYADDMPDLSKQNRDRTRAASVVQMQAIAGDPDWNRIGPSNSSEIGAPMASIKNGVPEIPASRLGRSEIVVFPDGSQVPVRYALVEADSVLASNLADGTPVPEYNEPPPGAVVALNNARTSGMREAYRRGTAGKYRARLEQEAESLGFHPDEARSMKAPLMIRLYDDAINANKDLGRLSNASHALDTSSGEQALNDGRLLNVESLSRTEGDILHADNAAFVKAFLDSVPGNERGSLVDRDGNPTKQLRGRLEDALMARAFRSPEIVNLAVEDSDPDIKNVLGAMRQAAPAWARLGAMGALDLREPLVRGAWALIDAKKRGLKPSEALAQGDMLGRDPIQDGFTRLFAENLRSPKRMAAAMRAIAEAAEVELANSGGMFAGTPKTKGQVLDDANEKLRAEGAKAPQFPGRGEAAQPGVGGGRKGKPGAGERAPAQGSVPEVEDLPRAARVKSDTATGDLLRGERTPLPYEGPENGNVDHPLIFSSGMSRRTDFGPSLKANHSIGIDIGEMSKNAIRQIAEGMRDTAASLFVDSGAFGLFRAILRREKKLQKATAKEVIDTTGIEPLDFTDIFDRYARLAQAIGEADDSGYANDRVWFVMPDIVGDQEGTLDLLRKFQAQTKGHIRHAQTIVPLQAGAMSLTEFYDRAIEILGDYPITAGIPSKAEAVSNDDFAEFIRERGDKLWGVHILGAASTKTAGPRLEVLKDAGFDGHVSLDANRLRGLWNKYSTRKEALQRLLAGLGPRKRTEPAADLPPLAARIKRGDTSSVPDMFGNQTEQPFSLQADAADPAAVARGKAEKAAQDAREKAADERVLNARRSERAELEQRGQVDFVEQEQKSPAAAPPPPPRPPWPAGLPRMMNDAKGREQKNAVALELAKGPYRPRTAAEQPGAPVRDVTDSVLLSSHNLTDEQKKALPKEAKFEQASKDFPLHPDDAIRLAAEAEIRAMYEESSAAFDDYKRKVEAVQAAIGRGRAIIAPLKGPVRAYEKLRSAVRDGSPLRQELKDILRSTILVQNQFDAERALKAILEQWPDAAIKRNLLAHGQEGLHNTGYHDILVNVPIGNGMLSEVQINFPEFLDSKEGPGHKVYEYHRTISDKIEYEAREGTPEEKKLLRYAEELQTKIYNPTWVWFDAGMPGKAPYVEASEEELMTLKAFFADASSPSKNAAQESGRGAGLRDDITKPLPAKLLAGKKVPAGNANTMPPSVIENSQSPGGSPSAAMSAGSQGNFNFEGLSDISGTPFNYYFTAQTLGKQEKARRLLEKRGKAATTPVVPDLFGEEDAKPDGTPGDQGSKPGVVPGSENVGPVDELREPDGGRPDGGNPRPDDGGLPKVDGTTVHGESETPDGGPVKSPRNSVKRNARLPAGRDIAPKSGRNYRFGPGDLDYNKSWVEKGEDNLAALKVLKTLREEKRQATAEEQAVLARYVGWGASELANNIFDRWKRRTPRWEKLRDELNEIMSPEEWAAAEASTPFAHYTSGAIVRSIWSGLRRMGFAGGTVFEPGAGIGVFPGLMPADTAVNSHYTGIELEPIAGEILKHLQPDEAIRLESYFDSKLPKNFYDLAIGNPPFADIKVLQDPDYKQHRFLLHDYFFAKTIDRVKPGGLLVFVTSKGTMDKVDDAGRKYLAERADLVAAVRLPQTAFRENAGTDVVTDVLFLRKKVPGQEFAHAQPWTGLASVRGADGKVLKVGDDLGATYRANEYYSAHPEMVLGTHSAEGSMYAANEYTVKPLDGDIEEHFAKALLNLPENVFAPEHGSAADQAQAAAIDLDPKAKKEGSYYLSDKGVLMQTRNGVGERAEVQDPVVKAYVPLRDAVKQAHYDQLNDGPWEASLAALQAEYEKFVAAHGKVNEHTVRLRKTKVTDPDTGETFEDETKQRVFTHKRKFATDPESVYVIALETIDEDTDEVKPAGPLLGRVLNKPARPIIKTAQDALMSVLSDGGKVDMPRIADLLGATPDQVLDALGDAVYRQPDGSFVTKDDYLSGNVVEKLREAEAAAAADRRFESNVAALKQVQPPRLPPEKINVEPGAHWIPMSDYVRFTDEVMGFEPTIKRAVTGAWTVQTNDVWRAGNSPFKVTGAKATDILDAALNKTKITVWDTDPKTQERTLNPDATALANAKVDELSAKFKEWIFQDPERSTRLVDDYNRKFNTRAARQFDGKHLALPGVSIKWQSRLFDHVKRGAWRIIQNGNTYLAHAVGSGKTNQMIISAMEQKRLGLIKKPMVIVPNHMLQQFTSEWMDLYPSARLMVADEEGFHTSVRQEWTGRVALSDLDGVIMTHSSFKLLDLDPSFKRGLVEEQLKEFRDALEEMGAQEARPTRKIKDGKPVMAYSRDRTVKQVQKAIERLKQKLEAMSADVRKDKGVYFSDLGVDMLYVDEAHEYRKLDFSTQRDVKGLDPQGSAKAWDLWAKTRWLAARNPDRYLVMASGTPITNTIAELYSVMKMMVPNTLRELGLYRFDDWASMFGREHTELEMNSGGKYENVTRFNRFVNVPEMTQIFRAFADVLTSSDLAKYLGDGRPRVKGGARHINVVSTPAYDAYKEVLRQRTEASKLWRPSFQGETNPDPIVRIITDGRLAAIDMRFVDPKAKDDPTSKLNQTIEGMIRVYKETADNEYKSRDGTISPIKGGTQMLFGNVGLGVGVIASRGFDSRAFIEKKLREAGIPSKHIAWMADYKSSQKKLGLFRDMNEGRKRILIGSPANMGTGVNAQARLAAIHMLDAPWFPSALEQAEGRGIRTGNQNKEVALEGYTTKGSLDQIMWTLVAQKDKFIQQALSGDPNMREIEDAYEFSAFEQAASMTADDPRVLQLAGLKTHYAKLLSLHRGFEQDADRAREELRQNMAQIGRIRERQLPEAEKRALRIQDLTGDKFKATANGVEYDSRKEWGEALLAKFSEFSTALMETKTEAPVIGEVSGFPIHFMGQVWGGNYHSSGVLNLGGGETANLVMGNDDPVGMAMRAQRIMAEYESMPARLRATIGTLEQTNVSLESRAMGKSPYLADLLQADAEVEALEAEIESGKTAQAEPVEGINDQPRSRLEIVAGAMAARDLAQAGAPGARKAFRRGEFDRPMARRGGVPEARPSVAEVRSLAARLVGAWTVRPELIVLRSMDDAPAAVRQYFGAMDEKAAGNEVGAFLWQEKLYVIAAAARSRVEVLHMVMHEGLGHYGMAKLYGKGMADILREIALIRSTEVRNKAKEYGLDFNNANERMIAAEEVLVEMAETRPDLGFSRRAIAAIRTWIRRFVPGLDALKVTDDEIIRAFIEPARRYIERATPSPTGGKTPTVLHKFRDVKLPSYVRGGSRGPVAARPLPKMPDVDAIYPRGNPRLDPEAKKQFDAYAEAMDTWRKGLEAAVEGEDAVAFQMPNGEVHLISANAHYPEVEGTRPFRQTLLNPDWTPAYHTEYDSMADAAEGAFWDSRNRLRLNKEDPKALQEFKQIPVAARMKRAAEGGLSRFLAGSAVQSAVYHGTTDDFTQFDPGKQGSKTDAGSARHAFFFTDRPDVAAGYARFSPESGVSERENEQLDQAYRDTVIDGKPAADLIAANEAAVSALFDGGAYLGQGKWRTPADRERAAELQAEHDRITREVEGGAGNQQIMPAFLSLKNPLRVDMAPHAAEFRAHDGKYDARVEAALKQARAAGNDGVIFTGILENQTDPKPGTTYAVFEPTQIKSAIGNRGTFDPANPDIRASRLGRAAAASSSATTARRRAASNGRGLLDRALRIPMQTAQIDRATAALWDLVTWAGGKLIPERVKAGVVSDYGLPGDIHDRRQAMESGQARGTRQTKDLLGTISTLTRAETRVLYQAATTADGHVADYLMRNLPPESQQALADIKKLVRDLGAQQVALGFLDADTFKRNEWAYLHRSYLDKEAAETAGHKKARAAGRRLAADAYKGRGISDAQSAIDLAKYAPGWWGRRLVNGRADPTIVGENFVRLEKRDTPLPGMARGRLRDVVYLPATVAIPPQFQSYDRDSPGALWRAADIRGGDVVLRRDFMPEERERMGEIDDIRYAMAITLHQAVNNVELGKFLKYLADNHSKTVPPAGATTVKLTGRQTQAFKPDEWVQVPDTTLEGSKVPRYGALAGRWVPGPVWNEARGVDAWKRGIMPEWYQSLLRGWKISKTALSPAVHMNNVMANFVLADWQDVGATHIARAAQTLLRKGKDPIADALIADYEDAGGTAGTWAITDLQRQTLEPILAELLGAMTGPQQQLGLLVALQRARAGDFEAAWQAAKMAKAAKLAAGAVKKMIDFYQGEDDLFRLAAYLKAIEEGASPAAAGKFAREAFLDYRINAPWIQALRQTALPFVSFTYRALPKVLDAAAHKPWKLAKLALVFGTLNAIGYALSGGDEDKERKWLPEEKAGRLLVGPPKLIRMPWDSGGAPVFMDVRRFIPVGDFFDTGQNHAALPVLPVVIPAGPIAILAELLANKSQFTGKPIVKDTDSAVEATVKVADHLFKAMAPNLPLPGPGHLVPGAEPGQLQTYAWQNILNAGKGRTDVFGREQSMPQALGTAVGVKVGAYSREAAAQRLMIESRNTEQELRGNIKAAAREYAKKGITREEFDAKVASEQAKIRALGEKMRERAP